MPYATIPDTDPVDINGEEIDKVRSFCYLSDFIEERGGCFDATTAIIISKWKKFWELLPILACRNLSLREGGHDYYTCVRSVLLYASETWTATKDVSHLNHNYMMMIRWIYSTKLADKVQSDELRSRLGLCGTENVRRRRCLRWYDHLQCIDPDTWPRKALKTTMIGSNPRVRPRKNA